MKTSFHCILVLTMLAFMLAACDLRFGEDTSLSGSEITPSNIRQIEQLTSIRLPSGAIGDHYVYLGSGIDDAMFVQLHWPGDALAELATALGAISAVEEQGLPSLPGKEWWKP